jgi:hypothetical protein
LRFDCFPDDLDVGSKTNLESFLLLSGWYHHMYCKTSCFQVHNCRIKCLYMSEASHIPYGLNCAIVEALIIAHDPKQKSKTDASFFGTFSSLRSLMLECIDTSGVISMTSKLTLLKLLYLDATIVNYDSLSKMIENHTALEAIYLKDCRCDVKEMGGAKAVILKLPSQLKMFQMWSETLLVLDLSPCTELKSL